jgi:hypothetical protein
MSIGLIIQQQTSGNLILTLTLDQQIRRFEIALILGTLL